jgi:hypothetical protein
MRALIAATAFCALAPAPGMGAAQDADDAAKPPLKPGPVRITTKAPEPEKWDVRRNAAGTKRVFKCKPLACPDPQTVSFKFLKSPTLHPDPKALEKFAKVDLPKSIRGAGAAREVLSDGVDKIETLSSQTATLKGYPSVVNESKLSRALAYTYIEIAIVFAGPVMIRVQAASPNRELAQKTLGQFIDVMHIEQGPAATPGRTKTPQGTQGT